MKLKSAALVFTFLPALGLPAQTPLTVDEMVAVALQHNDGVVWAQRRVRDARESLRLAPLVASSRLSVDAYLDSGADTFSDSLSVYTSLYVPVLPQLSLSARIDPLEPAAASARVYFSPFARKRVDPWDAVYARMAEIDLADARRYLRMDIEGSVHRLLSTRMTVAAQESLVALLRRRFDAAHQALLGGGATVEEWEAQRRKLDEAVSALKACEDVTRWSLYGLQSLLGTQESIDVAPIPLDDLRQLVASRDAKIAGLPPGVGPLGGARAWRELDLEAARQRLAAAGVRPDLEVSFGLEYNAPSYYNPDPVVASGSVSIGFSPSDLQARERRRLEQAVADAAEDLDFELRSSRIHADQAWADVEAARRELVRADDAMALARAVADALDSRDSDEAGLQDERDMAHVVLDVLSARLYAATAELAAAQGRLLALYSEE